jgi:hypothetical protein
MKVSPEFTPPSLSRRFCRPSHDATRACRGSRPCIVKIEISSVQDIDVVIPGEGGTGESAWKILNIDLSGNYFTTNTVFNLGPPWMEYISSLFLTGYVQRCRTPFVNTCITEYRSIQKGQLRRRLWSFCPRACRTTHVGRHFPSQSMTFSGQ